MKRFKLAALAVLSATALAAHAGTITFDDVDTGDPDVSEAQLAPRYAGLGWDNMWVSDTRPDWMGVGYKNAMVSAFNVAYNGWGDPASVHSLSSAGFGLQDGWFTAAWNEGLRVTAAAVFEDGSTASRSFTLTTAGPIDEFFGWSGLASVTFTSTGGVPPEGFDVPTTQFALDNLTVTTAVPEPAGAPLVLAGLALMAVATRRRRAR